MAWTRFFVHVVVLGAFFAIANAADCNTDEQRQTGDPSGDDIATALTKNDQLSSVCSGNFPPGNDKISTYNHWSMIYNVTRDDPSQGLQGCQDGFQNIIDQCITGDDYWGGTWSLNGFTYAIYNQAYPSNGLGPNDAGGPSSTGASGAPSSTAVVGTTEGGSDSTSISGAGESTDAPRPTTTVAGVSIATTSNGNGGTGAPPTTAAPSFPEETVVTETNSDGSAIIATASHDQKVAGILY